MVNMVLCNGLLACRWPSGLIDSKSKNRGIAPQLLVEGEGKRERKAMTFRGMTTERRIPLKMKLCQNKEVNLDFNNS